MASALLVSVGGAVVAAPTASAACYADQPFYSLTSRAFNMPFPGIPVFKNGPGGTMSLTKDYTTSVSAQVTAGASAELSGVLASAQVSISASLTRTNSSSVTNNYSHVITPGRFGNAKYVSYGRTVYWKKYWKAANCTNTYMGSGTINFPTNSEGWYYWETTY
jgi:hypothetical protein